MLSLQQIDRARKRAMQYFAASGIVVTPEEEYNIEVADFGLGELETTGLQLLVYINTSRYCAKELVLFPFQTCPEHIHPPLGVEPGKEETFRCRWGEVRLYVDGSPTVNALSTPPVKSSRFYTVWHEILLKPGEQYTIHPGTPHWFQSGDEGAVVSEFSSTSYDEYDIFRDPNIQRTTVIRNNLL